MSVTVEKSYEECITPLQLFTCTNSDVRTSLPNTFKEIDLEIQQKGYSEDLFLEPSHTTHHTTRLTPHGSQLSKREAKRKIKDSQITLLKKVQWVFLARESTTNFAMCSLIVQKKLSICVCSLDKGPRMLLILHTPLLFAQVAQTVKVCAKYAHHSLLQNLWPCTCITQCFNPPEKGKATPPESVWT